MPRVGVQETQGKGTYQRHADVQGQHAAKPEPVVDGHADNRRIGQLRERERCRDQADADGGHSEMLKIRPEIRQHHAEYGEVGGVEGRRPF
jgi:hypothetical protein